MIRIAFVTFFLLLGLPGSAAGQDRNAQGIELNEKGVQAFEAGRYAEAADAFRNAYDILGDPAIRKNEALAWFKAENCDEAVAAANKFLLLDATLPEDRNEMSTVIANCKVTIAAKAVEAGELDVANRLLAEAEQLEPDAYVRDQIKLVRIEIAKREGAQTGGSTTTDTASAAQTTVESQADIEEPRTPILGYALLGAGGAMVVAGAIYHAIALGWQAEFLRMTTEGGDPARFESLRGRVQTARFLVPVLYGLGIASAGTGIALMMMYEPADTTVANASGRMWLGFAMQF